MWLVSAALGVLACGGAPAPAAPATQASAPPPAATASAGPAWRELTPEEARDIEARTDRRRPEDVQATVRARFSEVRVCYERALAREPGLRGRVVMRVVIAPSGAVTSVTDVSEGSAPGDPIAGNVQALPDDEVRTCVAEVFAGLSFATAPGTTTFTYPMNLTPE